MVNHRDRLVSRGVRADQITQQWCIQNPGLCLLSQEEERTEEMCPTHSKGQLTIATLWLTIVSVILAIQ